MKKIISLLLVISLTCFWAGYGQFTTPAIDASFDGAGFYPANGVSGSTTWYLTWNNTDLFVFLQNANETGPVSIFLDVDPIVPVNGGTDANGTLAGINYDNYSTIPNLPFRADVLIYAHNGYREIFRRDGANGWTSLGGGADGICGGGQDDYAGNANGQYSSHDNGNGAGGDDRREFRVSWSRLLGTINGGARPAGFNWLGYVSYNNGMYAQMPVENYNGDAVSANSNGIVRYYTVSSTENGASTNPFSRNSYTHPLGEDNGAFGAITVWDFTMNSPGRTITRTPGNGGGWAINGNLVIAAGTVGFGTSATAAIIGNLGQSGGTLALSSSAGGDLQVAGNFSNNGTFTNNGRTVTFNGTGTQSVMGNTTFGQIANSNIFGTITVATGTTIEITVASNLNTAGSVLAVQGTLRCNAALTNTSGDRLLFGPSGTYEHNYNGGDIPTATWDNTSPGSTCSIIGWVGATGSPGGLTPPGGFSNFTWNSPGQTGTPNLDGNLQLVNRRLTITCTGTNKINLSNMGTPNLTVGEILINGGRLANNNGNAFQTIYCNGDFTVSSGSFEMNAIGAAASYTYILGDLIHTGGTISRTGGNQYFGFNGISGIQNITISNPANVTGAVNFRLNNPDGVQVTNGSTFPINGGAVLQVTQGNVTLVGSANMSYGTSGGLATLLYDPTGSIAVTTKDEWPLEGMRKVRINSMSSQPIVLNATRTMDAAPGTTILFESGRLSLGAYDLIISNSESSAVVAGGGYAETNGTGQLIRYLLSSNNHIYNFPVGNGSNYTLASYFFYTNSLANRQLGVRAVAGTHPQMNNPAVPVSYLANRYWATTLNNAAGTYSYSVTYYFKAGDEIGTPAGIRLSRWNGYSWINANNSAVAGTNINSTLLTQYTGTLANGEWTGRIFKVPITYTWNLANSGSWIINSNWDPVGVPLSEDIVLFTHSGNYEVNNVPADVNLGRMLFSGGGTTTLLITSAGNVYFGGGGNPVFNVEAGTTAIISGNISSNWIVLSGNTGSVSGNVQLRGTTGNTAHTLQAEDPSGLSFEPGSNFYAGVINTLNFSGNPFGSGGTDGTVVFKNGSTFEQFDGANPFGMGSNKVIFQTGSLYRFSNNNSNSTVTPSFSGRSYANFEYNSSQNKSVVGGSAFTMDNLTVTQGTFNINMTGTPGHSIRGNITVAAGAGLSFSPSAPDTVLLNGAATQTISGSGSLTLGSNATMQISNTSGGVDLEKNMTVNGTMSIAANGILNARNTNVVSGTGTFNLLSDGILGVGSPDGLFSLVNSGNIQTTTRAFSSSGLVRFNGSAAQNTGNFTTAPIANTLKGLYINNPAGLSLSAGNNNITVSALALEAGSFTIGAGQQVNISAGGSVDATGGDFATGSAGGTVFFGSAGSFSGNSNPFNVRIQGLVNFGAGAVTIQDGGTFRIDQNGGVVSNAPYYAPGSTLQYSANGDYQRFLEWNATSGRGNPHHVRLTNGTVLSPARNDGSYAATPFVCNGNLTIENGNSLYMDHSGNSMAVPLEIAGNILIEGNLSGSQIFGGDIKVGGTWTRQGAGNYFPNNRAVFFNSSQPATITNATGAQTFAYLVVDKDGSVANTLTLASPVDVTAKFTLSSGRVITTSTNLLTISNSAPDDGVGNGVQVEDYDNNPGFVDGPMQRNIQNTSGGESYLFPVGKTDGTNYYYKRFKLRDIHNSSGTHYFRGEYMRAQPPGYGDYFFGSTLNGILANEYWNVSRLSGTAYGRLVLPYTDPGAGGWVNVFKNTTSPFSNANVAVVRGTMGNPDEYNWNYTGPDSTFFSNEGPEPQGRFYESSGDVKSRLITDFSHFTIGFGLNAILPINLLSFTAFFYNEDAHLAWKLTDVTGLKHFELEHSKDGQRFTQLAVLALHGNAPYSYKHINPGAGMHYYRLQMVEKNGRRSQSKTEALMVNANRTLIVGLLQNPIRGGQAVVRVYSATNQVAEYIVLDMAGKTLLRQKIRLVAGYNQPVISLLLIPEGMYKLVMRTGDGVEQVITVIK